MVTVFLRAGGGGRSISLPIPLSKKKSMEIGRVEPCVDWAFPQLSELFSSFHVLLTMYIPSLFKIRVFTELEKSGNFK